MLLDNIDKKLLNLVQAEFPLVREPYADLGQRLGIDEGKTLHRLEQLKAMGIIRQISPVIDARSLGYQTTLVAMRVAKSQLDKAAQVIASHPGVSHGYERDHHFNLWFTLALPPTASMESELRRLADTTGANTTFALPAIKIFKIGVYFDMAGSGQSPVIAQHGRHLSQSVELSRTERLIINELQQDLPLAPMPFTDMAAQLSMNVDDFLTQCQTLLRRGIIRRFSASINHNKAGFKANAMTCWIVPPDMVDVAGQKLTSLREVSHCYERKTNPHWRYNLFAMIHGHTRDVSQSIARSISREIGVSDYVLLFSTKEFKKMRVKYLV